VFLKVDDSSRGMHKDAQFILAKLSRGTRLDGPKLIEGILLALYHDLRKGPTAATQFCLLVKRQRRMKGVAK